jgi:hypothetical protein
MPRSKFEEKIYYIYSYNLVCFKSQKSTLYIVIRYVILSRIARNKYNGASKRGLYRDVWNMEFFFLTVYSEFTQCCSLCSE